MIFYDEKTDELVLIDRFDCSLKWNNVFVVILTMSGWTNSERLKDFEFVGWL